METSGEMAKLPKKEESAIKREMARMQRNFNGITEMGGLPSALFVVDVNEEEIAVAEARRCEIPCIGLVDTNSDPTALSHPIPGNDDAVKSIRIIVEAVTAAIQSGLAQRDSRRVSRGQADLRAAAAAKGEIDLDKIVLPKDIAVEEETGIIPTKKPARLRKAPVKAE
jgi:small subunit ribosomal protein S2